MAKGEVEDRKLISRGLEGIKREPGYGFSLEVRLEWFERVGSKETVKLDL